MYFSGTSGLVLPTNKSDFAAEFQHYSRLQYYATLQNSIEINSSFYKIPQSSTVTNWMQSTDDQFLFTFKIPKLISHARDLHFSPTDVQKFLKILEPVEHKKGCLLLQFPSSLAINRIVELEKLLQYFQKHSSWRIAIEFRNPIWYVNEVYEMLQNYTATIVQHDMKGAENSNYSNSSDFVYFRFHGPQPRYRGSYSNAFLQDHAASIKEYVNDGKIVFAYFNNTVGDAFNNLQTLNRLILP